MNSKIEKLAEWGSDVKRAMNICLDDEDFYLECLNTIPGDENFPKLEQALRDGDVPAAFACAHTLKGILANMGLTKMYDKTVEIVEPLRRGNGEKLMGKMEELMEMRSHLSEILK